MYPELLHIGSFTLYSYALFVVIGLFAAAFTFRILADKTGIPDKAYNFYLLTGIGSIAVGFLFAMLFQSVYYLIETGEWTFGAMTFMGGLIGGVACFILVTALLAKKAYKAYFWRVANLLAPSILVAHAFGRIGCFMNGCCYGRETDGPLGVLFPGHTTKVIPTQLIESAFLFVLFAVLLVLILRYKRGNLPMLVYLYAYSVFRFVLEFFRGDDRGEFLGGITPSQWQSVFTLLAAVLLTIYIFRFGRVPFAGRVAVDTYGYELPAAAFAGTDTPAAAEDDAAADDGSDDSPSPADKEEPDETDGSGGTA